VSRTTVREQTQIGSCFSANGNSDDVQSDIQASSGGGGGDNAVSLAIIVADLRAQN